MSFRTIMLDVADTLRALTGPAVFDIRTTQVTIRTRTYVGGRRNSQSAYTDSDLVLPAIYKIKQIKTSEISASGGKYEMGDIAVGAITPRGDTLGWTVEQLQPKPTSDGVDIIYVLTGEDGHAGEYTRVELRSDKPFSYYLILRRTITDP